MCDARPTFRQSSGMPLAKYRPFLDVISIDLPDRTQSDRRITTASRWLNTDLRDGNRSFIEPMGPQAKCAIFDLLVSMGPKGIEIGFPAASQTDFDFVHSLVDDNAIPEDVVVSVLVQSCDELVGRTLGAYIDIPRATVHLCNTLPPLSRNVVFHMDRDQIRELTVGDTRQIIVHAGKVLDEDMTFNYKYSPEIFVDTELDYSLEVCQAVIDVWQPEEDREIILNLPTIVERTTLNVYTDQIEWMSHHLSRRESVCLSLRNHNDRNSGVAAAELGLMVGANRAEGCLFGHGEYIGNTDLVTLVLNLLSQDADPVFDLSDIDKVRRTVERATGMNVPLRTSYAGELVYTSFSGSHQDAIKKGFAVCNTQVSERKAEGLTDARAQIAVLWAMSYLPIDPRGVDHPHETVAHANSQPGKGEVVYLPDATRKFEPSRRLQIEFFHIVQRHTDTYGGEIGDDGLWSVFVDEYLPTAAVPEAEPGRWGRSQLRGTTLTSTGDDENSTLIVTLVDDGAEKHLTALGDGPLDAFVTALESTSLSVRIFDCVEHALSEGRDAKVADYVECEVDSQVLRGVGIDPSIATSSSKAVISAISRALR